MFHIITDLQDAPTISVCQILCGRDIADRFNVDQLKNSINSGPRSV
jgi:hypothetical protein